MRSRDDILNDLRYHNVNELVKKYEVDELLILMNVVINKGWFNYIDCILKALPKSKKYDKYKLNLITYLNGISPSSIYYVILNIYNDQIKIEKMKKHLLNEENYKITNIICSLNSDEYKPFVFKEFSNRFNSESFSNYLKGIKDDDIRTKEFNLYKEQFSDYRLDWIAGAYSTDAKRIEFFKNNFTEDKTDQIASFISFIESEELKIKVFSLYHTDIAKTTMWEALGSINDQNTIIELLKKFASIIPGYDIEELILKVSDLDVRYQLLNEYNRFLDSKSIVNIIQETDNYEIKLHMIQDNMSLFDEDDLRKVLTFLVDKKEKK